MSLSHSLEHVWFSWYRNWWNNWRSQYAALPAPSPVPPPNKQTKPPLVTTLPMKPPLLPEPSSTSIAEKSTNRSHNSETQRYFQTIIPMQGRTRHLKKGRQELKFIDSGLHRCLHAFLAAIHPTQSHCTIFSIAIQDNRILEMQCNLKTESQFKTLSGGLRSMEQMKPGFEMREVVIQRVRLGHPHGHPVPMQQRFCIPVLGHWQWALNPKPWFPTQPDFLQLTTRGTLWPRFVNNTELRPLSYYRNVR